MIKELGCAAWIFVLIFVLSMFVAVKWVK